MVEKEGPSLGTATWGTRGRKSGVGMGAPRWGWGTRLCRDKWGGWPSLALTADSADK